MNKKLAMRLIYAGLAISTLSIIWWYVFYSKVLSLLGGGKLSDAFKCWYSSSDNVCATVTAGAKFLNQTPYEPWLLYIGLLSALAGVIATFTAKE